MNMIHSLRPIASWGRSSLLAALTLCAVTGARAQTLDLSFSSPATNSAPGATFVGAFTFSPTTTLLSATVLSGTSIVPVGNISLNTVSTNGQVTLVPLTNQSGTVTARITGISGGTTNVENFTVVFRPYPPVISVIPAITMPEDGTTNVSFIATDPDGPDSSLVVTAQSSNPSLINAGGLLTGGSGSNRTVSITPLPNINGIATVTVFVADDVFTNSRSFQVTVTPVPDPPTVSGVVNRAFGDDVGLTNVLATTTIADVDHNMPLPESITVTVSLASTEFATFANNLGTYVTNGNPTQVTAAVRSLPLKPLRFRGLPGTLNPVVLTVQAKDSVFTVSTSATMTIEVMNTPPTFTFGMTPTSVVEGASIQPFRISGINDPDQGDEEFTLALEFVNPAQTNRGSISLTGTLHDNVSGLQASIQNVLFQAAVGAITSSFEDVDFRMLLTDGYGGTAAETNTIRIYQSQTAPSITGIPVETLNKTDGSSPFVLFPSVFIIDPDQGGAQLVSAVVTQSMPSLGTISTTTFPPQLPSQLSTALRAITFTPTPGALPIGASADTILTITVTDSTGLTAQNSNLKVHITSVNNAPQILNIPAAGLQPVILPPTPPILPFAGIGLTNDDANNVLFTITMDNSNKGSLTNLGSFVVVSNGTYQMTGKTTNILQSLTNIIYNLNPGYLFPPDDPGGTTFSLSARDYALLTTTKSLYIQVQNKPRNHLVTRLQNDGLPGSFTYALANLGNNDVITFALPEYPAVVRMPGASANTIIRNARIKGPGAHLLTISGDGNGDETPDRQIFCIAAQVTIEGVTLAHGTAGFGGAISVQSNGFLTLRQCAVVDSVADQYGGAIDVDGGKLTLDGCFIGRNRLAQSTGMSGAGVSVYSDREIQIVNTTFAGNVNPNESGDGGGALVVQNLTAGTPLNAYVTHCTFAENEDQTERASAAYSVGFGTRIRPKNSIFADFSGRNLDVTGAGEFISQGGNLCDDSTKTILTQQGQSQEFYLLDDVSDLTETDPVLAPLNDDGDPTPYFELLAGSPAIDRGLASTLVRDQRGVIRTDVPDSGSVEFNALGRLVINEIGFKDGTVNFVEIYVRRDSSPVDLSPYSLFLDGVKVHDFSNNTIVGTNDLHTFGSSASPVVYPGFGIVVAFTNQPFMMTSASNATPVVRPSVTNAVMDLPDSGTLVVGKGDASFPVARHTYLGTYLDPATGTNVLDIGLNSISLAPQFLGFALVPHAWILPGPFSGVDPSRDLNANTSSPGSDSSGTPFGQSNAEPLAVPDLFTVTEDDLVDLDVLANDYDSDGNDRRVIVDISAESEAGVGDVAETNSVLGAQIRIEPDDLPLKGRRVGYDPRFTAALQALPVGVEMVDTFHYEILDYGFAAVEDYADSAGDTLVQATNHRLQDGDEIEIRGASHAGYNGTFAVTVVDEDSFTIPTPYVASAPDLGEWETVLPRSPTSRSEASVTVRVIGVNDIPTAVLDVITNVAETSTVRVLVRPELAGTPLVFPGDPVPPPVQLTQDLLSNDDDVDTDDSWGTLRIVGVMGAVNEIADYTGTPGETPVTVHSPGHGLTTGDEILIANYGGHPSYNGYHIVTVLDDDSFSIPKFFVDDAADKGVWVVLNDANRYHATTDVGADVTLTLRANAQEDNVVYDASVSDYLRGLAEGELFTNRFFYALVDRNGGIGIGPVDVVVTGVNNPPTPAPDAGSLSELMPLVNESNTLEDVLSGGLDLMYTLPPASGGTGVVDLFVLDLGGELPGTVTLRDFFSTDEDTPLSIPTADLLANDTDIDRLDVLDIVSVEATSRKGAAVSLGAGTITYDPTVSSNLQALAREEMIVDTFHVVVSDGMTGGDVTSLVAVLVIGMNDTPVANPVFFVTNEDEVFPFDPRYNDVDLDINLVEPDDRITIVGVTNLPNPGQARVDMSSTGVVHDATVSDLLNQLADWQSFTNVFNYTITDNSFLFAVDDDFYVPAGTVGRVLDVLSNDRDFTDSNLQLTIEDAGPTLHGGVVSIATNGQHLIYSSPPGFVGDDYFRYIVRNDAGDVNSGRVMVRSVVPRVNGVLLAADDHYAVAAGETAILNVTTNDDMLPNTGSGVVITGIVSSSEPGQPVLTNNTFVYTATNGLTPLTFRYAVSGGGASHAEADVTVQVIERRGSLLIRDDMFSVLPGSFDNELDPLGNDGLVTQSNSALRIREILDAAANGTITTNAAGTRLVYTPAASFIGTERIRYLVTDQVGGTGTGLVSIVVGKVETASDFYTIAASTNPIPVALDVLANDQVMPQGRGTLKIVGVSPAGATAIGSLQVAGGGAYLSFTPTNAIGQLDFNYMVEDLSSPARVATGRVTIATVGTGVFANPDRYIVRGNGSSYVLNVLTNDISYPNINKIYSILSIGTGPNAPNQGGSVSIVNNQLMYTPAPGFFGEESFTYQMTDSFATDVAQVTVSVRPGGLYANDDDYAVFYEIEPGTNVARSFTLPVTFNDRILPPFDQVVSITALGVGSNAPNQGGSVQIDPGNLSLTYRPATAPASNYVEQFTYEISDGGDRRASATVRVLVLNRASNLVAMTQADAFAVARNSQSNFLNVLANDYVLPGKADGWKITGVSASLHGAALAITNGGVRYSAPTNFVGVDQFTYEVTDGLGGTGSALVQVRVGSLPTLPDLFTVLSGSVANDLNVTTNDVLTADYSSEYVLHSVFGASHGGVLALSGHNTVLYTPNPAYVGPYPYVETFHYRVADDSAITVTGDVRVIVHKAGSDRSTSTITLLVEGRNDAPSIQNVSLNTPITDKGSVKPFLGVTLVEVDEQHQEKIEVVVSLDLADKGKLVDLGPFTDLGGGAYGLSNVTAAAATLAIRDLRFIPTENRIPVPTTETTFFTISITDHKSPPVLDTHSAIPVTAVNDAPTIAGTVPNQEFYYRETIQPFSTVTIGEVDDLTVQPLRITARILQPTQGVFSNLGSFVLVSNGVYTASNLTAAAATAQLRALLFSVGTNVVPPGGSQKTFFLLSVSDGYAPTVDDLNASVIARNAFEATVRPTNVVLQGSFGLAVDAIANFAVVGAPRASPAGAASGSAFIYRRVAGTTNTWVQWRQLQPASVETNDQLGRAVSMTDSNLAVGAIADEVGGIEVGAVYLYGRHTGGSNNWGQLLRIAPTGVPTVARFGLSVCLDGDLLAVGAPDADLTATGRLAGAVFLYGRNQGGPDAWGEILRWGPDDVGSADADFGWDVALKGDALVVGAPRYNVNTSNTNREGAVYYLSRNAGGSNQWGVVQRLTSIQTNASRDFGWNLALESNVLAVGAPSILVGTATNGGQVFVYEMAAGTNVFSLRSQLDRRTDTERRFGYSVALDQGELFVGAPNNDTAPFLGAGYLLRRVAAGSTNWTLVEKFTRPTNTTAGLYGSAVGFKRRTGIVGAPADYAVGATNNGFAFIYRFGHDTPPVVAVPIPDQFAVVGQPFQFNIPTNTFLDPDGVSELQMRAEMPDGSNGLTFASGMITGTPLSVGAYPVVLTVTDPSDNQTSTTFRILVSDGAGDSNTVRQIWNANHFGSSLTNPALEALLWGPHANPDGDGRNNDQEYVFGGNPNSGDDSRILISPALPGRHTVSYLRRHNDPSLSFELEGTTNMMHWFKITTGVVDETSVHVDGEIESVNILLLNDASIRTLEYRIKATY